MLNSCHNCKFWAHAHRYMDNRGHVRAECAEPIVREQFDGDYPASCYADFGCFHFAWPQGVAEIAMRLVRELMSTGLPTPRIVEDAGLPPGTVEFRGVGGQRDRIVKFAPACVTEWTPAMDAGDAPGAIPGVGQFPLDGRFDDEDT